MFVDDGHDLDWAAVGGGVELEVHGPYPVRRGRRRGIRGGGGAEAFAAAALRHPEAFFAPQPLDLLVVDLPAFTADVVVGAAEAPPGMGLA